MQNQEGCSHAIRSGEVSRVTGYDDARSFSTSEAAVEHIRRLGGADSTTVGGSQTFSRDRPANSCFWVALMSKTVTVADHDLDVASKLLGNEHREPLKSISICIQVQTKGAPELSNSTDGKVLLTDETSNSIMRPLNSSSG